LRIDVPDHEQALKAWASIHCYGATNEEKLEGEFLLRHLLGSRKNDFAYHMGSWTKDKLIEYCSRRGFAHVGEEPNIHFYPAFCLVFRKVEKQDEEPEHSTRLWDAAWQYANNGRPLIIPSDCSPVLEVGPGGAKRAWPRADAYVDIAEEQMVDLPAGKNRIVGSVENIPVESQQFNYVLCSHVLEHCDDPEQAGRELARVAQAGCIICPSVGKDFLFNHHEPGHKWWVYRKANELWFLPTDKALRKTINVSVQSIMHKLLRLGAPQYGPDGAVMREWWRRTEPYYDIIYHWNGAPDIKVMR
ncbi:MAG: class I SAM-dependent methyltransferase, partial [Gammaproteobacteria bacterium]